MWQHLTLILFIKAEKRKVVSSFDHAAISIYVWAMCAGGVCGSAAFSSSFIDIQIVETESFLDTFNFARCESITQ